jgi:3-deoxy-D-manno-octulosonate 8-phosphate phosphatase KdsC-like HAD superfamily phosphatase
LTNISELLASADIAAGKYTQIRIVVTSVTATMTNGTMVNMTVPSGELKTTHPFNVTAGATSSLTLEIDLERAIVQNGSGWIFTPVLGAVTESS